MNDIIDGRYGYPQIGRLYRVHIHDRQFGTGDEGVMRIEALYPRDDATRGSFLFASQTADFSMGPNRRKWRDARPSAGFANVESHDWYRTFTPVTVTSPGRLL